MNCSRCGTQNPDANSKCFRCGSALVPLGEAETLVGVSLPPSPPGEQETLAPGASPGAAASQSSSSNQPTAGPWGFGGASAAEAEPVNFGPRYRIERLLGQGGMGAVYQAHDQELDRTVALKLIRPGLAVDPATAQRFKQELLLASKISHKNILRIHDLGDAAGVKFISMAYVEGQDLHALLQKEGKLPLERALKIARQLCTALEAAHAEGVAHRDFKPQNILLDRNDHVYVSDFGLAKSLEEDVGMTRSGEYLGTPRYMAPEQVEGKKADQRIDLYALGLILYEMLTGDVPFHADTTLQLMYKRVHEQPKSPKTLNPELPDWLVAVVMKCLERNPERRYQSAQQVLADLEKGSAPLGSRTVHVSLPTIALEVPAVRLWMTAVFVLALAAAIAFAIPSVRRRLLGGGPAVATQSAAPTKFMAVLPFRVQGGEGTPGYLADGVVDALYAKFFGMKDLQVAAPAAVQRIKPDDPLPKVAHELGSSLLVSGTVQSAGDRLRIIVNLDRVPLEGNAPAQRVFSQEFSGVQQDLLTLEDQIYARLFNAIEGKETSESIARTSLHPTENYAAYELYLKGRSALRGQVQEKEVRSALGYYQQAVKMDPGFALAYTGIADADVRLYRITKDSSWPQQALSAAQQAQQLSENLPEVHFALGSAYNATGRTAEAVAELRRAVELAPTADEGYRRLGDALRAAGNKEESIAAYNKAIQLNPYYWFNYNALGSAYFHFGEMEKALQAFKRVSEVQPDIATGYQNMGVLYCQLGEWDPCVVAFQKALEFDKNPIFYSNLGTAYFYLKRYDEAAQMALQAIRLDPNSDTPVGNLADAYRWSGKRQDAIAAYDKALALGYQQMAVNPKDAATMGRMAQYFYRKGDMTHAVDFIRRARSIDPKDPKLVYVNAQIDVAAHRTAAAWQELEEALRGGYSVRETSNDPELNDLQSQPQFAALLKQYEGK